MRITKYSVAVIIVSALLIIGLVAYNIHSRLQPSDHLTAENGEKMAREKYEKGDRKRGEPPVIATYGKIPTFETEEQRQDWLNNLGEIRKSARSEMHPYIYPAGPVVGYGLHFDGYMRISFEEEVVIEKSLMDEIYGIIDKQAKKMGIQDVPVVFDLEGLPVEDEKSPTE
ncbi:MAG: hypothetical protein KAT65_03120 [Methanophagales archaeon]|nr:hypothetical protein [Methanophagales archaeon]